MLVGPNEIRNRIDELKVSQAGYRKQLGAEYITPERRERLELEVAQFETEIATLEKLARLYTVDPSGARIEEVARRRLGEVRGYLDTDPNLEGLSLDQREVTSGEARALVWVLGEDAVSRRVREMVAGREPAETTARNLPGMLMRTLQSGQDADARAGAAYEIGRLGIAEAIPRLVAALEDDPRVSAIALDALSRFSDAQLAEAEVPAHVKDQIRAKRQPGQ